MKLVLDDVRIMRRFFGLVRLKRIYVMGLFVTSFFGHGMDLLAPIFSANIIQAITDGVSEAAYWNIGFLFLTYVVRNFAWYFNYWLYAKNHNYSYQILRGQMMRKVLSYDLSFAEKQPHGVIVNTINDDVSNLAAMIDQVTEMVMRVLKLLVVVAVFLKTNIWIGLIVLFIGYLYAKMADFTNVKMVKNLAGQLKYRDKMTDVMNQVLTGLSEVKTMHMQNKVLHNFDIIAKKWSNYYMRKWSWQSVNMGLLPLFMHFWKVVIFLVFGQMVLDGRLPLSSLVFLVSYFDEMRACINSLMNSSKWIKEKSVSIDRVKRVMDYKGGGDLKFGDLDKDDVDGLVRFSRVGFWYRSKGVSGVSGVSFVAKPNQITALVGRSGSGKSTLAKLLMRKYRAGTGRITLDGKDILRYKEKTYASNVAMVDQTPFMFNMSIRKNLAMVDANFERQKAVCKRVGIHEAIMELPAGYNTVLSENASNFSGGQKQLLAIARTLLTEAEVLVFDEVTSALDAVLTEKMKALFEDLKQDHTIIMVTHRRDMMQLADQIVVMDRGRMVGCGSHAELMQGNKYYIDIQTHSYVSKEETGEVLLEPGEGFSASESERITEESNVLS